VGYLERCVWRVGRIRSLRRRRLRRLKEMCCWRKRFTRYPCLSHSHVFRYVTRFEVRLPTGNSASPISRWWSLSDSYSMSSFKFFFWVLERSLNPSPVYIAKSEAVGDLKKLIKQEMELSGPASDLSVWKVSNHFLRAAAND